MKDPQYVNPHNEGHSKAHAEAFASLVERLSKATQHISKDDQRKKAREKVLKTGILSKTHRTYPRFGWDL